MTPEELKTMAQSGLVGEAHGTIHRGCSECNDSIGDGKQHYHPKDGLNSGFWAVCPDCYSRHPAEAIPAPELGKWKDEYEWTGNLERPREGQMYLSRITGNPQLAASDHDLGVDEKQYILRKKADSIPPPPDGDWQTRKDPEEWPKEGEETFPQFGLLENGSEVYRATSPTSYESLGLLSVLRGKCATWKDRLEEGSCRACSEEEAMEHAKKKGPRDWPPSWRKPQTPAETPSAEKDGDFPKYAKDDSGLIYPFRAFSSMAQDGAVTHWTFGGVPRKDDSCNKWPPNPKWQQCTRAEAFSHLTYPLYMDRPDGGWRPNVAYMRVDAAGEYCRLVLKNGHEEKNSDAERWQLSIERGIWIIITKEEAEGRLEAWDKPKWTRHKATDHYFQFFGPSRADVTVFRADLTRYGVSKCSYDEVLGYDGLHEPVAIADLPWNKPKKDVIIINEFACAEDATPPVPTVEKPVYHVPVGDCAPKVAYWKYTAPRDFTTVFRDGHTSHSPNGPRYDVLEHPGGFRYRFATSAEAEARVEGEGEKVVFVSTPYGDEEQPFARQFDPQTIGIPYWVTGNEEDKTPAAEAATTPDGKDSTMELMDYAEDFECPKCGKHLRLRAKSPATLIDGNSICKQCPCGHAIHLYSKDKQAREDNRRKEEKKRQRAYEGRPGIVSLVGDLIVAASGLVGAVAIGGSKAGWFLTRKVVWPVGRPVVRQASQAILTTMVAWWALTHASDASKVISTMGGIASAIGSGIVSAWQWVF